MCHMPSVSGLGGQGDGEHRRSSLGGGGVRVQGAERACRHLSLELRLLQPPSGRGTRVGHSPQAGRWARKSTGSPWRRHR